jgi:hypothetical protein
MFADWLKFSLIEALLIIYVWFGHCFKAVTLPYLLLMRFSRICNALLIHCISIVSMQCVKWALTQLNIYVLEGGASNQVSASLVRNFSWNPTSISYVNSSNWILNNQQTAILNLWSDTYFEYHHQPTTVHCWPLQCLAISLDLRLLGFSVILNRRLLRSASFSHSYIA